MASQRPKILSETPEGHCRWPLSEDKLGRHVFCGRPRGERVPTKYPYCETHWYARFPTRAAAERALLWEAQAKRKNRG